MVKQNNGTTMRLGTDFLILYTLLWVMVFYFNIKRQKFFGSGSLVLLVNVICAIFSVILYNNQIMSARYHLGTITSILPLLYLFISELVFMAPLLRFNESKVQQIYCSNIPILRYVSYLFIISSIVQLPFILSNMQQGLMLMTMYDDGGADVYAMTHEANQAKDTGIIMYISGVILNRLMDIGIIIYFFLISKGEKNKFIKYGYLIAFFICLLSSVSKGLRTGVTLNLLTFLIAYITMRKFLPDNVTKYIKRTFFIIIGVISFFFITITVSRFGDREGGTSGYVLGYVGQANINFANYGLDANGIRNGDRTMNVFKSAFGFSDVPEDIAETRMKYSHMKINDSLFYTYIGDFTLDFGPIVAFLLFVLFSLLINGIVKMKGKTILFHHLLALYFVMCICIQGSFYMFNYSYRGNNTIIAFILLYLILLFDYNIRKKSIKTLPSFIVNM